MQTTRALTWLLVLALLALAPLTLPISSARAADPTIVRVTTSGTTTWPCGLSDWSNPCALQTALSNTVSGSELWVAAGTYTPTVGVTRTATFHLVDGVALYGGFATTETLRSQRNFTTNVTVLSGDLKGDDNGNVRYDEPTRAENAYHVVTGSGVTTAAVLDGFTITGGNANGDSDPHYFGGGMYNEWLSNPTLTNLTFRRNTAVANGGGMYNDASYLTPTNVTFSGNLAGQFGGGMFDSNSNLALTNATFSGNLAESDGGGMFSHLSSPTLTNVTFSGNSAASIGGGLENYNNCLPLLTNVTFSGNSAKWGGGMVNGDNSNPTLTNVTFSGNSATAFGGGMYNGNSNSGVRNTIFWGNTAPLGSQVFISLGSANIWDSVVQGGCPAGSTCTTIITTDPRLGALGDYGGATQTIPLLPGSSAIDAGNDAVCPPTDQRGIPRPQGAHCDIGAYEAQLTVLNLPLIRR